MIFIHRKAIAVVALIGLSACATVEGAGKDIQNAGKAISDASEDVQS